MKTSARPIFACFALAVIVIGLGAAASVLHYTYDSAGRLVSANYGATTNISYAYDDAGNLLLGSAPAPAIIVGAVSNGQVTLSWSSLPAGYVLQSAAVLGSPAAWSGVSAPVTQVGELNQVTIALGSGAAFYRLRLGP